jgi:hypothetical protein
MRSTQNNLQINLGNAYTGNFNIEIRAEIGITVSTKFSILLHSKRTRQNFIVNSIMGAAVILGFRKQHLDVVARCTLGSAT